MKNFHSTNKTPDMAYSYPYQTAGPWLKRYPLPIVPGTFDNLGIYAPGGYGAVSDPNSYFNPWHGPTSTIYGNCDCSVGNDYVQSNNCNLGYPVCGIGKNCMCYRPDLGSGGCFNERGGHC